MNFIFDFDFYFIYRCVQCMTRAGHSDLMLFDPKLERIIHRLNHTQERNMTTEDPRLDMVAKEWQEAIQAVHHSLNNYITLSIADAASSIRRPPM